MFFYFCCKNVAVELFVELCVRKFNIFFSDDNKKLCIFAINSEVIHNKDYSVVKTLGAVLTDRSFYFYIVYMDKGK